jgi:8-oxo-dGTP diphosphatase
VTLLLLRHVHAGDRATWDGDDRWRPVSARGLRQALALVDTYADHPIAAVLTSPYTRCVQSVEPLAAARGLPIDEVDELAEGAPPDVVDRLLRRARRRAADDGGAVVLCSHGDVIGSLVHQLLAQGIELPTDAPRWEKGSTWVLDGEVDDPHLAYLPPPA